jgi:hypothetical protein
MESNLVLTKVNIKVESSLQNQELDNIRLHQFGQISTFGHTNSYFFKWFYITLLSVSYFLKLSNHFGLDISVQHEFWLLWIKYKLGIETIATLVWN